MSKIVFLIGMPGAGKTEWGRRIASQWQIKHIDLDEYIQDEQGQIIHQLFKSTGEQGFRKIESAALRQIILENTGAMVLSTGGGTPIDAANLSLMKEKGKVIYLKASIDHLIQNIRASREQRPLLEGSSPQASLAELYDERRAVYEQAHHIFEVETFSLSEIEPIITECIKQD